MEPTIAEEGSSLPTGSPYTTMKPVSARGVAFSTLAHVYTKHQLG